MYVVPYVCAAGSSAVYMYVLQVQCCMYVLRVTVMYVSCSRLAFFLFAPVRLACWRPVLAILSSVDSAPQHTRPSALTSRQ
jgi:hypothetical protein